MQEREAHASDRCGGPRRAKRTRAAARSVVSLASLVLLSSFASAACSCGAVGVAGPQVLGAREDTGCPSADDALAHTRRALGISGEEDGGGDALAELRPELTRILVEEGGLRVVFQGLTAVLADTDPVTTKRLLSGIHPEDGFGALTPHLVELLRYVDGSSSFSPEAHLEPMGAMHDVLVECEAAQTIATFRRLLQLEVIAGPEGPALAEAGQGGDVWLQAVLDAARAALVDPALRDLLERIELEDPDGAPGAPGSIRVGREAFLVLARLLAANLAAPDFDPAFTRDLLDDVLLSRVTDEAARARVAALLDLMLLVTDPAADVFPQMQSLMECLNGADAEAAIPGLLFDWLTIDELSVDAFLEDVSSSTEGDSAADLRLALLEVLGAFEARPAVAADVSRVMAGLLDERVAPMLVRAALALRGTGLLGEVTSLADAVAACHPELR